MLLGTIMFGIDSKAEAYDILINNEEIEDYKFWAGFYLSITAGFLSVVTGIVFYAFRIDEQVPGLRHSHSVSVVRPEDTGLYKTHLQRKTFTSFQPNMPSRYNHMLVV